jgi:glutathione peroxidase-family protein
VSLENPYLICSNRNPGGVGFDFEYKGEKGGANNMDSLTVSDFEYDLKIRTIKVEKTDGSLGGSPFIQLYETVKAVNYSSVDTTCKGYSDFQNLTSSNIQNYTLQSYNSSFNLASVPVGATGSPLMQNLNQELNKLVIGQRWKEATGNTIADDEPIWIIQTREGKIVKFIVTQMPANPAPTSTGYVKIEWNFVQ